MVIKTDYSCSLWCRVWSMYLKVSRSWAVINMLDRKSASDQARVLTSAALRSVVS